MDLVLDAGAGACELFAARQPAAQNPAALVRHQHRLKLAFPQQAGQRSRVQLVRLSPSTADPSVIRLDHHHPLHVRLEDPRHLQQLPVTSSATRSVAKRLSASALIPSGVLGTRPADRVLPFSQIATSQKSR